MASQSGSPESLSTMSTPPYSYFQNHGFLLSHTTYNTTELPAHPLLQHKNIHLGGCVSSPIFVPLLRLKRQQIWQDNSTYQNLLYLLLNLVSFSLVVLICIVRQHRNNKTETI